MAGVGLSVNVAVFSGVGWRPFAVGGAGAVLVGTTGLAAAMLAARVRAAARPTLVPMVALTTGRAVFDMDGTLTTPALDFGRMYERCGVAMSEDLLQVIVCLV
ncbi:hypothetical protein T492DRAFT_860750 [Pavlovales sp. CCMP2436]|nr:hypothetical protein T492DRAFT_860750 [Pavlovales sp. CCMP2436]